MILLCKGNKPSIDSQRMMLSEAYIYLKFGFQVFTTHVKSHVLFIFTDHGNIVSWCKNVLFAFYFTSSTDASVGKIFCHDFSILN